MADQLATVLTLVITTVNPDVIVDIVGVLRPQMTDPEYRHPGWCHLTDRERAVAEMASRALTNQQIARALFISTHTVNFHLRNIYHKLGISSRVELAACAPRG
jgi:DNA-binding CsgD family transcriptional regulator